MYLVIVRTAYALTLPSPFSLCLKLALRRFVAAQRITRALYLRFKDQFPSVDFSSDLHLLSPTPSFDLVRKMQAKGLIPDAWTEEETFAGAIMALAKLRETLQSTSPTSPPLSYPQLESALERSCLI